MLLREKGSSGRAFLDTVFEAHGLIVSPLWESASTQALVRAVASGIGLSILPEKLVRRALEAGVVQTRPICDAPLVPPLPHRLAPKQIPFSVAQAADRADEGRISLSRTSVLASGRVNPYKKPPSFEGGR